MTRTIALMAWLVGVWMLLWGDFRFGNFVGATLVAGIVVLATGVARERPEWRVRTAGLAVFVVVFARELVKANLIVLRQVLTWRNDRFREAVVAYRTAPLPAPLLTVLSNLITLTPGTMTLELRPEEHVLYVHLLHLDDLDEALAGIRILEGIVVGAFATREDAEAARAFWQSAVPGEAA